MKDTRRRHITQLKYILENEDLAKPMPFLIRNKIRLEKVPPGKEVLCDRGFADCTPSYPNLNMTCLFFLNGRPQYTMDEVSTDRIKCKMRYSSKTNFARLTSRTGLKDRVPRGFYSHLKHINNWAHGCNNLQEPFYVPSNDNYCVYQSIFIYYE